MYIDGFKNVADMLHEFDVPPDALAGATVLYAKYTYENYSGNAFVLYKQDGKLYEVNASHCSCVGLEGQWNPELTFEAALCHRFFQRPDSVAPHKLASLPSCCDNEDDLKALRYAILNEAILSE